MTLSPLSGVEASAPIQGGPEAAVRGSKLDAVVSRVVDATRVAPSSARDVATSLGLRVSANRALLRVVLSPPAVDDREKLSAALAAGASGQEVDALAERVSATAERVAEALRSEGAEVTGVAADHSVIQAWIPVRAISSLAGRPEIVSIQEPLRAISHVTSQGVGALNGTAWHGGAAQGAGVRVGVIDLGFLTYASKLGTELPSSVTVKNFVPGETDAQVDGGPEHGTAVAEIVHDVAPQASLYLAKISSDIDLQNASSWLTSNGVSVINTSLGFYNAGPGDGTGFVNSLVATAKANGILWVTSAGNERQRHWGGAFVDSNGDGYHNFTPTDNGDMYGSQSGVPYGIPPGVTLAAFLRWSDWTNVNQNLDLHIVRYNSATGTWNIIASSTNPQNGTPGQTPTEAVSAVAYGTTTAYGVAIQRISGTSALNLDLYARLSVSTPSGELCERVGARSLSTPADSPHALTVAAVDYATFAQEPFSSEGPTNGPGGAATGGFTKPDVSAYDGVATSTSLSPFFGTSAASPHVAGAAAVNRAFFSGTNRTDLIRFSAKRAIDIGVTGLDTVFGYGREYLGAWPSDFDADGRIDDGNASGIAGDATCTAGATSGCDDNCPFFANGAQADGGGVGAGSPGDGRGDDCQCGDVTADTRVSVADATVISRALLVPPTATMTRPDLCDVSGDSNCSVADSVVIQRALLSPPTATIVNRCTPAIPPAP